MGLHRYPVDLEFKIIWRRTSPNQQAIMDIVSFIAEFSFLPPSKIPTYNPILILACYRYHGQEAWRGIKDKAICLPRFDQVSSGQSQS